MKNVSVRKRDVNNVLKRGPGKMCPSKKRTLVNGPFEKGPSKLVLLKSGPGKMAPLKRER